MKTAQIICDILQTELELEPGQVMVYNQRFKLPASVSMFITVGYIGIKPYSNTNKAVDDGTGLSSSQSVAMAELLSINIMSANTSSIDLYPFVLMAIASNYAQMKQNDYQFTMGIIPTASNDTSFLEETSQMSRQTVTLQVLRSYSKMKPIVYYDTFTDEILTEQGVL